MIIALIYALIVLILVGVGYSVIEHQDGAVTEDAMVCIIIFSIFWAVALVIYIPYIITKKVIQICESMKEQASSQSNQSSN